VNRNSLPAALPSFCTAVALSGLTLSGAEGLGKQKTNNTNFMFQLSAQEPENRNSQIVTSNA